MQSIINQWLAAQPKLHLLFLLSTFNTLFTNHKSQAHSTLFLLCLIAWDNVKNILFLKYSIQAWFWLITSRMKWQIRCQSSDRAFLFNFFFWQCLVKLYTHIWYLSFYTGKADNFKLPFAWIKKCKSCD